CVVLDLRLPDMSGFEVLEEIKRDEALSDVPVVVFTGRELSAEEDAQLHTMARSIVVKGVESPERLLDETALFLHRVITDLPSEKQKMLERLNSSDEDLVGRTVLLVDDDSRNIFALSSVLERRGMKVLTATTGHEALEFLLKNDVAIILIDVCMPELDGFQLAAMIREHPRFQKTAIIFISAIHLTDVDRLRGYEMGAVDYVPVPVVPEVLRAKVKVFAELYRKTRELEQLNAELERRVAERTADLEASTTRLLQSEQLRSL